MLRSGLRGPIPLLLFILIFANVAWAAGSARAAAPSVSLHTAGEVALWNGSTPVLVAGIWHQVTVNLTAFLNGGSLTLRLALPGASPPGTANTYEWVRAEANDSWYDPLYGAFLRRNLSSDQGISVTFGVGVDALATPGRWTLEALEGNVSVVTQTVEVQAPRIDYGVSSADFAFRVDPYTPSVQNSESSGEVLTITNRGNVPLATDASFDLFRNNLSLVNAGAVAHVGSAQTFSVGLSVGSLPPQVVAVNGTTGVSVAYVVPSPGSSVLVPSFQQTFHVQVVVGHLGYHVQLVGNVAFQTLDTVHASYGSLVMWQVYLSGLQNVSLGVSASGATLRGVVEGGTDLPLPAMLSLSGSGERALTVQVGADQTGTATVTFTLHLLATGDIRTFTTTIPIEGGPSVPPSAGGSLLWFVGAFATISVFGFIALGQLRHRARGSRPRPPPKAMAKPEPAATSPRSGPRAKTSGATQPARRPGPRREERARKP